MVTGCITWLTVVRLQKNLMNIVPMMIVTFLNVIAMSLLFILVPILIRVIPEKLMMNSVIRIATTCGLPAAIPLVRPDLRPLIRADVLILTATTAVEKPVTAPTRNAVILNPMKLTVLAVQRLVVMAAAVRAFAVQHVQNRNRNQDQHQLPNQIPIRLSPEVRKTTVILVPALLAQLAKAAQSAKLIRPALAVQWYALNAMMKIPAPGKAVRPAWLAARKAARLIAPRQAVVPLSAPSAMRKRLVRRSAVHTVVNKSAKVGLVPRVPEQNLTVQLIRGGTALIPNRNPNQIVRTAICILPAGDAAALAYATAKPDVHGTEKLAV